MQRPGLAPGDNQTAYQRGVPDPTTTQHELVHLPPTSHQPAGGAKLKTTLNMSGCPRYFCQVRFLWRLARSFLRRLCLLILAFRRFFNEPIRMTVNRLTDSRRYSGVFGCKCKFAWHLAKRVDKQA
jgi:hypothetical protein